MQTTSDVQMPQRLESRRGRPLGIENGDCPVRGILDTLGDKWNILVVTELSAGEVRFNELRRRIPDISQKMLTQTLRGLQRDGLVVPSTPPYHPRWNIG
jgi:DNA-binding HxlR family transcriptional regulator